MIDLGDIYERLARDWLQEELRRPPRQRPGSRRTRHQEPAARRRPRAADVASALPPAATLDVAVYVLHILGATTHADRARRLLDNAQQSVAAAQHRCHRALELGLRTDTKARLRLRRWIKPTPSTP